MWRFLVVLFCVVAFGVAAADVVFTTDGRRIVGKIVREDDEAVVVKTSHGTVKVAREDVERIERGKLPEEIYREKARRLPDSDAEGHYKLGLWCKKNGLYEQAKKEFQKAIAADPNHAGARRELGYKKIKGRWVIPSRKSERQSRKPERQSRKPQTSSVDIAGILRLVDTAVRNGKITNDMVAKLKAAEGLTKKDFRKVEERIRAWKTYKPQRQVDFSRQIAGMEVFIHLPQKYDPKKPYPLILVLHGAGDTGRNLRNAWANTKTNWGRKVRAGYIVVAPTWRPAYWWQWPKGRDIYTVLEEVKNSYNVDTNRVLLTGFSNGGHSAWALGMKQPSLFAAVVPMAGLPAHERKRGLELEMLANFINLPVYLLHSANDPICPSNIVDSIERRFKQLGYKNFNRKEFPSGGHTPHFGFWGTIFSWFSKLKRNMYPKKVVFMSDHAELNTAYWLRLESLSPRAKVTAKISGSTITIKASNTRKLTVFLSDRMLDLDKPVNIVVNGKKVFSGVVKRSALVALQEALRRNDRNAVYAAAVTLPVR